MAPLSDQLSIRETFDLRDSFAAAMTLTVEIDFQGKFADFLQQEIELHGKRSYADKVQAYYAQRYPNLSPALNFDIAKSPSEMLLLTAQFSAPGVWQKAQNGDWEFLCGGMIITDYLPSLKRSSSSPFPAISPAVISEVIHIQLPETWNGIPEKGEWNNAFFAFSANVKVVDHDAYHDYRLELKLPSADASVPTIGDAKEAASVVDFVYSTTGLTGRDTINKEHGGVFDLGFDAWRVNLRNVNWVALLLVLVATGFGVASAVRIYRQDLSAPPLVPGSISELHGVSGWLAFVYGFVLIWPLVLLFNSSELMAALLSGGQQWTALLANFPFGTLQVLLMLAQGACSGWLMIYAGLLILMCHRQRIGFQEIFQRYWIIALMYYWCLFLTASLLNVPSTEIAINPIALYIVTVAAIIQLFYLPRSRRASVTFVYRYDGIMDSGIHAQIFAKKIDDGWRLQ